ncbi:type III polyketide synthase [Aureitalea marina]|uniref:Type III polyketide synthase n=1 Tax=Aureitalea marina TaxID=930804 RepID=A0A2S7KP29_9FLAO|nr:type III polyketide synthase [Aureitalea marina]PQB04384.1 type III polyketide synthase [Aureitalea marina]
MAVKIISVAKQLPKFTRSTAEILPWVELWLKDQPDRFRRKILKIFEGAGVDRRYSIMDAHQVFHPYTLEERNDFYVAGMKQLGGGAVKKALEQSNWQATDLDYIITVSCTGIMIPSIDAYLINEFEMRQDIVRLPVTEMGCAAGISGMIYAKEFLEANPGKRAIVLALESPTATFQLEDFSMVNMVSAAIFGDGAAAVLMSSREEDQGPQIKDQAMYHFYNAAHMMGFKLVNTGLQMILDKTVPEQIASHFPKIIHPFLEDNGLQMEQVDHLIFHPGGRKIVQTVEELFGAMGKEINDTREVLKLYGNMSSVTVLYVLERFLNKDIAAGEYGLMLSFGPGFSAQRILIEF